MTNKGLPVKGYSDQGDDNVAVVNVNKEIEERVMRQIDLLEGREGVDKSMTALAKTNIQQGFMWLNRAVFQPGRIELPEDKGA